MTSTYPQHPGYKVEGTSAEAAAEMAVSSPGLRDRILELMQRAGNLTTDEAAERLGADILGVRPRFSELRQMQKIEPTELRRTNRSGLRAIVWRLKRTVAQAELF